MSLTFDELVAKIEAEIANVRQGRDMVLAQVPAPARASIDQSYAAVLANALTIMLTQP